MKSDRAISRRSVQHNGDQINGSMNGPIGGSMNKPQSPDDNVAVRRQHDSDFLEGPEDVAWNGCEQRRLERYPVAGSRPIALRPLDSDGQPAGPWILADILDISVAGLCLLITGSLDLQPSQKLELDLRSHPNFPWHRVAVQARWCVSAESFSTLGLCFDQPLTAIPRLAMERRGQRRDLNQAHWATI